ncbi:MAG: 1-deoxy-D-xylulose-5-phosphate synthase [Treponema sp.]|nr:1-deoxy-D-xylulose-5-phosphate synthase [Treponema sp.]MCL2272163.1 1-deoxy-D-xylulose-5-phosphate synthase [Treponema sp.]
MKLLENINLPGDIKNMTFQELNLLAQELREQIVSTVSANGGHLASNLGTVELSIALHRVFNSPQDKIIWDVGHQCYAHKLLTGRYSSFQSLRKYGGLAGFPKRSESPHDAFNTGHASTSISAALGLLSADRMQNGNGYAIAVIGDGALTGGMAYEALSHAGHLGLPLIVILNDNKMSISQNVGGMSKYLSRLSMKANYQTFRLNFDTMAKKIPFMGEAFFNLIQRLKRAVKAVFYTDNFFVDLGYEYVGPIDGHNIRILTEVLEDVRKLYESQGRSKQGAKYRPVVIHAITLKGKGYSFAEDEPDIYHGVASFPIDGGLKNHITVKRLTFTQAFSNALVKAAQKDEKVVAVTAAMKTGTGLTVFADEFPWRLFDVGIAEEHAATFASGLAAGGLKPVAAVYSTFIQRSFDQIIHDAALQKLPVIFALDRAGFVEADGETHQGLFDIALFRSVPNMTLLSPASEKELQLMLEWALDIEKREMSGKGPVVIRYPKAYCPDEIDSFSKPVENGRGVWVRKDEKSRTCILFTGGLYPEADKAASILENKGINIDLYNLRFLKPLDEDYFISFLGNYSLAVILEEGIKDGGFGEYAASLERNKNLKILVLAANSVFYKEDRCVGTRNELLAGSGLDSLSIVDSILKNLQDS